MSAALAGLRTPYRRYGKELLELRPEDQALAERDERYVKYMEVTAAKRRLCLDGIRSVSGALIFNFEKIFDKLYDIVKLIQ